MYDKIVNQCENLWLRENYNLSGYSTILWCTTNQEYDYYETDYLHTLFWIVTFLILGIVTIATALDIKQNNEDSLDYYKVERRDLPKSQQCLLCFSLVRNWYRLVAPPKTEVGRDLRFVLTIRYLTTLIVVMGHVWIAYSMTPAKNTEFVESSYYSIIYIFANCATNIVQTFFVASGVLLYISIHEFFKEGVLNIGNAATAFIYRYIRLTPTLAYLILYHATYLFHSGSGGYWKFVGETSQTYCRRNWWTNLLYINNYVNSNQMCIPTTWYLSADTHLFLFSLCLLLIIFKYPKLKKIVMGLAILASCVTQFLVTYLNKFDGGQHVFSPETKRFLYDNENKELEKDYFASHMNAGNFLIGICLAMTYFHFKENKIDMSKYKWFIVLWYITPVIGFFTVVVHGYTFFHNYFEVPSIGLTILSMFTRQIWGIFGIILVLGFIASFRSPIKNFFNWPVFTPLSRLTYGIYLVHVTIASIVFAQSSIISYFMGWSFLTESVALFVLSNFAALILGLCIEFPLTALSKILLRKNKKERKFIKDEINGHAAELKKFTSRI
ncbi:O-acyltransferase like protein-like [Culicoides brevitarsis]|uniref:O-acyltransferase like protein-like n=1 Tax=Culicoides brevitarsis TaxID=469753 RepID=UPI00307B8E4A